MKTHLPDGMKASSDPVAELLRASKTIAVVGLSANPARPSNEVAAERACRRGLTVIEDACLLVQDRRRRR